MVTTLHNVWLKHRRAIIIGGLLVLGATLLPHLAHAAAAAPATQSAESVGNNLLSGLSQMLKLLQAIFWPILLMIGSLMQNDILFGAGMEQRLLEVWVQIRNVVNILFVLILLGIALINVLGRAKDDYHIKTILPKFVIALIAVNFTFIGIKVVLDSVNIVATAFFALPNTVEEAMKTGAGDAVAGPPKVANTMLTVDQANGICKAYYGDPVNEPDKYNAAITKASSGGNKAMCNPTQTNGTYLAPDAQKFFSTMSARNGALVMAVALGKADLLDKVYVNEQSATIGNLAANSLFSVVLYVVYGTAFVALFVTLLIRLVVLWVMIAVSPLMVLPSVLPESMKGMLGEGGDLGKKFVENAIVPIPIALIMSIGYIMLSALKAAKLSDANAFINSPTLSLNLLTSGLTTLQDLIISFGMVAFVWVGVFAAMDKTYAKGITGSIKGLVEGAGKTLGKFAVGSIPLFPTARGPASIGAVGVALKQMTNIPQQKWMEEAKGKFPELMVPSSEVGNKIGTGKDMQANRDYAKKNATRGMLGEGPYQQGWGTFFESANGKKEQANFGKWFANTALAGKSAKDIIDALKAGKVSPQDMETFHRQAGIEVGSGPGPVGEVKPGEAAKNAERSRLLDPKSREKMKKDGLLNGLTDSAGNPIGDEKATEAYIKKLETDSKSKDPAVAQKAKAELDRLAQQIKDKEKADLGNSSTAKAQYQIDIQQNPGLLGASEKNPAKKETLEEIEKKIQARIEQLSKPKAEGGGGLTADEAKKQAVQETATSLGTFSADQKKGIAEGAKTANAPLLTQALGTGATAPTAPTKPTAGGGGGKPATKPPAAPPPKPALIANAKKPPKPANINASAGTGEYNGGIIGAGSTTDQPDRSQWQWTGTDWNQIR